MGIGEIIYDVWRRKWRAYFRFIICEFIKFEFSRQDVSIKELIIILFNICSISIIHYIQLLISFYLFQYIILLVWMTYESKSWLGQGHFVWSYIFNILNDLQYFFFNLRKQIRGALSNNFMLLTSFFVSKWANYICSLKYIGVQANSKTVEFFLDIDILKNILHQ